MATQDHDGGNGAPKLNVIFHGAIAFVLDREHKQILAELPTMPHHVYRAGSWLAETEIKGGGIVYELNPSSVEGGDGWLKKDKNVIVKFDPSSRRPQPFATFKVPQPKKVTSLRTALLDKSDFEGTASRELPDKQPISLLQIFTYEIADQNAIFIDANRGDGHHWQPAFTGNHINLHVFASEDHFQELSNADEDFNKCMELFDVDLRLQQRNVSTMPVPVGDMDGLDIAPEETEDLPVRTLRMARLGRLKVENRDTNLAWFGADALDSYPRLCGGGGGDDGGN
jgi:hypothetical protein